MKFIIDNDSNLTDLAVMKLVTSIVEQGRVSSTSYGEQYCFATVTPCGHTVTVTKRKTGTETFRIYKPKSKE